ncbi:hypothetical protein GCM10008107_01080 [Psychrosphaera saromensis]|uniref:Uncharacterized protein n=1 Tax=Psychrosphaera saromensis TaxID=716813 RepID=A0A2S7V077_9GAMM|nr:hypothetical protein [Psychrosphaera saromensis]PQJ54921.1 hypothetical protein BTO11_15520 [Psychrosphaera saromensis]GHB56093.1 hypothetical protein GCM10008107_01080 [Psychrosphaera saromensis]GLQ13830.1 hypothetical protein GCM10007917_12850 [Psychrosphaera saromensis]
MNVITEAEIKSVVKKHLGFAIFMAMVPIVFIQLIVYFSGDAQLSNLALYIAPISTVVACSHFIKNVLVDINANHQSK